MFLAPFIHVGVLISHSRPLSSFSEGAVGQKALRFLLKSPRFTLGTVGALSTGRPQGSRLRPLGVVPLPLDDFLNTPLQLQRQRGESHLVAGVFVENVINDVKFRCLKNVLNIRTWKNIPSLLKLYNHWNYVDFFLSVCVPSFIIITL